MANTIRASKNTFNGGLVMDLSPDNTPNEVLTSALNATLVTFNGNELLLLNDMGNGRVETARLPDGYIPVGTCEFGDIIYIVSYNPLTNRSQIGCFPSPERNISSEEVGSTGQGLTFDDFLEAVEIKTTESSQLIPTGELKNNSVRKILYDNTMNPGDKYIIYDKDNNILNEKYISDIGNTSHVYSSFPKLLKIHVVAIEDSGKMNYLDSTLRWYEHNNEGRKDYFMMPMKEDNATNIPDIDSYRNLLSSGYSVFLSKISGKLALLIELEKITGFSCTYNTYTSLNNKKKTIDDTYEVWYKGCKIYWNINWYTDNNNINPKYLVLTESEWNSKEPGQIPGHFFLWGESGNTVIADNEVDISNTIPIKYSSDSWNDNYWFTEISRLYDPSSDISYKNFMEESSYDVLLNNIIKEIRKENSPYNDRELYKLNISRYDNSENDYKYTGLPKTENNSTYYNINLISVSKIGTGIPVMQNIDGENLHTGEYLHILYSDDMLSFTYNKIIGRYIGRYVDNNPTDSDNPKNYSWQLLHLAYYDPIIIYDSIEKEYTSINNSNFYTSSNIRYDTLSIPLNFKYSFKTQLRLKNSNFNSEAYIRIYCKLEATQPLLEFSINNIINNNYTGKYREGSLNILKEEINEHNIIYNITLEGAYIENLECDGQSIIVELVNITLDNLYLSNTILKIGLNIEDENYYNINANTVTVSKDEEIIDDNTQNSVSEASSDWLKDYIYGGYIGYISDVKNKDGKIPVSDYILSDDTVNNYFNTSVSKFFFDFEIPVELQLNGKTYVPNISNLIYHYEITPAMDYGLLREYAVEGYIDFSKIGTGTIDLTYWKYYNTENLSTLTIGLDAYVEEDKGIAEVVMEFYDNQGFAAAYHIRNKESYSGIFTEIVPLNGATLNLNLNAIDVNDDIRYHRGIETNEYANNVGFIRDNNIYPLYYKYENNVVKAYEDSNFTNEHTSKDDLCINDAGIIYSNAIYLVKIIVKYCQKDVLGKLDTSLNLDFRTFYRWFWTNTVFNDKYYNTNDFNVLSPTLVIDTSVQYSTDGENYSESSSGTLNQITDYNHLYKSAGYTLQKINNQIIKVTSTPYLFNNYNTFKLYGLYGNNSDGVYKGLNLKICLGKRYIENYTANGSKEPPILIHTGYYDSSKYTEWKGMEFVPGDGSMASPNYYWRDSENGYKTLTDDFKIYYNLGNPVRSSGNYIGKNSETLSKDSYDEISYLCTTETKKVFNLNLQHYSKYYGIYESQTRNVGNVIPLAYDTSVLDRYGITTTNYGSILKQIVYLTMSGQGWDEGDVKIWTDRGNSSAGRHIWVDHDVDFFIVIDVYNLDANGSTFKGTWFDGWNDYHTCQLSQFNYVGGTTFYHRLNGGSDNEGTINPEHPYGWNPNLTQGDGRLLEPGFFAFLQVMHRADDKFGIARDNAKNNDLDSGDFITPKYAWGLGFINLQGEMHFFNTGATSPSILARNVASLLSNIYIYAGQIDYPIIKAIDLVYLLDNYTQYSLDVIYLYQTNGNCVNNELITIYDYNYIDYVKLVLINAGINVPGNSKTFKDTDNIVMNNVNINLEYTSRNIPLEFKMNYKKPSTIEESDYTGKVLVSPMGGSLELVTFANVSLNTLYLFDRLTKTLNYVNGNLKYPEMYITPTGRSAYLFSIIQSSYFNDIFKYEGDYLQFVNREYSSTQWYYARGESRCRFVGTISDLLYYDILFNNTLFY